jgi:hypothetical protein
MHVVPVFIVLSVVVGLGIFALDFYKNRHRLSQPANPGIDSNAHALDTLDVDGDHLQHHLSQRLEGAADQVIHSAGTGIEHVLEGLSHHLP